MTTESASISLYELENPEEKQSFQLLTFTVGKEEYGMDIMNVREIKGWTDTTRLPNTPPFVRGVMNLRGSIIPIFDLRSRFGMGDTETSPKHVVIIFAVAERTLGILVDTVSDILIIKHESMFPAPAMETAIDDVFVSGLISLDKRMVVVLNTEELFDAETLKNVERLARVPQEA